MKISVTKIHSLTGHNDCIYALEPNGSGSTFFSASGDGMVVKWDLSDAVNGNLIAKINHSIYALHVLPNKNALIVGDNSEGIHVIDMESQEELGSLQLGDQSIFDVKSLDDKLFVSGSAGSIWIVTLNTLSIEKHLRLSEKSARCIAIHPSKPELAVGYSDHLIRIIDLKNLTVIQELQGHTNSVFSLAYSNDGKLLVSGSRDAHLIVWDTTENYQISKKIPAHMYAINNMSFNSQGTLLATCSMDKTIKIWDGATFKLLKVIDKARHAGHGTSVNKLFWSKNGDILVTGSDDRSISVWNLQYNN